MPRHLLIFALLGCVAMPATALEGWHDHLDAARQEALATGRPILVDLFAEWCGWCHKLEDHVFTDTAFRRYAEGFVRLRVDVEDGQEGTALRARFGIDTLPSTLILDAELTKVGEVRGFHPPALFVSKLADQLERYEQILVGYGQVLASDDPRLVEKTALYFRAMADSQRSATLYQKLAQMTPSSDVYYRLAESLELGTRWTAAREALSEARRRARSGGWTAGLGEQIELLDARIAQGEGDCRQAITTLETFLDQHPKSPLGDSARRLLGELRSGDPAQCV